ncbi:MAG: hypothetical protein IJ480_11570 [Clostridia bacterium]|nr:hypothetical protein [Clostridia bacterium]
MEKRKFSTEMAYVLGLVILAFSTAMMERAAFGMSMVVAPAYLLHRWLAPVLPMVTFGTAEYILQGVLLLLLIAAVRRFRLSYLFSFVTAVIYGFVLDGCIWVLGLVPEQAAAAVPMRLFLYIAGMIFCAMGVSLMFRTYISPEVYELFVKEFSDRYNRKISVVKTVYDCISCAVAVVMSFAIFGFGKFVGVQWGTIVCALINGWIIGLWSRFWDRFFVFHDRFAGLKKWFR